MVNYLEILRLNSLDHSQRTIESTVHSGAGETLGYHGAAVGGVLPEVP